MLRVMSLDEREKRRSMRALRRRVGDNDVQKWADTFLTNLEMAPERPPRPTAKGA